MLRNDNLSMISGMLKIQQLTSIKMHIKPNPDVKRKLIEQENKIKYNKALTEEQKEIQLNELGIKNKKDQEDEKLGDYNKDAKEFKILVDDFLNKLPANPDQAAQLIHYCSMRLFNECETIDDALPYKTNSYHQQRCALFQECLYEQIKMILKTVQEFDRWITIFEKAIQYKDILMMNAVHSALINSLPKNSPNQKFNDLLTPQLKTILEGKASATEQFNPIPPSVSYFKIKLETEIDGKLEAAIMSSNAQSNTLKNHYSNKLSVKNITDLLDVLRKNKLVNANWAQYIQNHCTHIYDDIFHRVQDSQKVMEIIQTCLEAMSSIALQALDQKSIDDNKGIVNFLKNSCINKKEEIQLLQKERDDLGLSFNNYRDLTFLAAESLLSSDLILTKLHLIFVNTDLQNKEASINELVQSILLEAIKKLVEGLNLDQRAPTFDNKLEVVITALTRVSRVNAQIENEIDDTIWQLFDLRGCIKDSTVSQDEFQKSLLNILSKDKNLLSNIDVFIQFTTHLEQAIDKHVSDLLKTNTNSLFNSSSSSSSSQMENSNFEYIKLMHKIIMSHSWKEKKIEKGDILSSLFLPSWNSKEINRLRMLFGTNKRSDDDFVIEINNVVNKICSNNKKKHQHVDLFLNSINRNQKIKTPQDIKMLQEFVIATKDEKLIKDCGLNKMPASTQKH